jgi:hypothetical protein
MRFPARPALLVAALGLILGATCAAPTATAADAPRPPSPRPLATDAYGDTPGDGTMLARELVRHPNAAVRARAAVDDIKDRPNYAGETQQVICSATVPICVHYTTDGADAPGPITPQESTQQLVLDTLTHIYSMYQAGGFRMPEADDTAGPGSPATQANDQPVPVNDIDIYLADIGDAGYYGYCVPTDSAPKTRPAGAHDTSAFCVLDNDYSASQFSRGTPLTNMEVTAAHEFFHAVQFSYDSWEDSWFMEATAVWMEDVVFNAINDNTQYLPYGPLGKPAQSLDKPTEFGVYGAWIFFRWLTEHRPQTTGQIPNLILSMWQRADSSGGTASDHYSLQAVKWALKKDGLPMTSAFAKFAAANRDPRHDYREGKANRYPKAKPTRKATLSKSRKHTAAAFRVNHLAAATERFKPRGLPRKAKLRISVNMADKKLGSGAMVTVFGKGGTTVKKIKLGKRGNGSVTVPFGSGKVKRVEVTLANGSTRMKCWTGHGYSCDGTPKDNGVAEQLSATVKR